MTYPRVAAFKTVERFRARLAELGLALPCDDGPMSADQGSPLAMPLRFGPRSVGNRWCVHPMEGWDGTPDGKPSDLTLRRWGNFGASGCKLIWGGEAFAVQRDARANPNQLCFDPADKSTLPQLLETLRESHCASFGESADADLVVGLQLTHSGRFSRPERKDRPQPRIAYHHPLLDSRVGIAPDDDAPLLSDDELERLIDRYVAAARAAAAAGFDFVDIKACHGYLVHEFLSAYDRPGPFGGNLEGRSRLLRSLVARIRDAVPQLLIGVRLSLFDQLPHRPDPSRPSPGSRGVGLAEPYSPPYPGFGCDRTDPTRIDLAEPVELMRTLYAAGVSMFNLSAGSPYYNPHMQRPAYFPPSDGYGPPEDPLVGCVRQITAVRDVKRLLPDVPLVGSAYTYFQEFLPHVAQAVICEGWVDSVGIGRLILSDWTLPARVLRGEDYAAAKKICRTFSDCTTGPRNGLVSGCYPLDEVYKALPDAAQLKRIKQAAHDSTR